MENLKETLPPGLADAAINIPGVGAILQLLLNKLGFDVGSTMSLYLLLFGLFQGALFLYTQGRGLVLGHGTSAIRIDDDDDLYPQFISWISEHRMTEVSRDLKATSKKPRARGDEVDDDNDSESDIEDVLDESGIFNYDKYKGTSPVYYEPNLGDDSFTHNGHYFQFSKDCQENKYQERIEYFIIIRCIGRSTKPVKDLIDHVKEWSAHKPNKTTEIMRAEIKHGGYWSVQSTRPSRPISTVTLDEAQKNKVVADINEYLHPATARWYAARGIPHRRGYLFHGPPGTGKTSLSFAIAGIFGLSVYCASLSERDMSESDLASLFGQLPNRCIVLLEDIDSAGIRRDRSSVIPDLDHSSDSEEADKLPVQGTEKVLEKEEKNESKDEKKVEEKQNDITDTEKKSIRRRITQSLRTRKIPKPDSETTTLVTTDDASAPASVRAPSVRALSIKAAKPPPPPEPVDEEGSKSKISLAGLLNIIDGAASSEGRVLIMTTNYPEKLDSALIRPGRVDLQIKFTLATNTQIQEIFRRMYSSEADLATQRNDEKSKSSPSRRRKPRPSNNDPSTTAVLPARPSFATLPPERLAEMAKQFAEALPEATFSPAEIQGYLLQRKSDPQGALDGVTEWRDAVMEAKKKGKKIVDLK
jgi:chaperone BCS1